MTFSRSVLEIDSSHKISLVYGYIRKMTPLSSMLRLSRYVEFRDALPKSCAGKIDKKKLSEADI